jgi:hypothetical protein
LGNLGNLHMGQGRWSRAASELSEALRLTDRKRHPRTASLLDANLGVVMHAVGELELSRAHLQRAVDGLLKLRRPMLAGLCAIRLAATCADAGSPVAAREALALADPIRRHGGRLARGTLEVARAHLALAEGDLAAARSHSHNARLLATEGAPMNTRERILPEELDRCLVLLELRLAES